MYRTSFQKVSNDLNYLMIRVECFSKAVDIGWLTTVETILTTVKTDLPFMVRLTEDLDLLRCFVVVMLAIDSSVSRSAMGNIKNCFLHKIKNTIISSGQELNEIETRERSRVIRSAVMQKNTNNQNTPPKQLATPKKPDWIPIDPKSVDWKF